MSTASSVEALPVPLRVRLLGHEFTIRVRPGDEARTRESVAYVDGKLMAFRQAHPQQNETTAALMVALALGDELLDARDAAESATDAQLHLTDAILGLDLHLAAALTPRRPAARTPTEDGSDDDEGDDFEDDAYDDDTDAAGDDVPD